MSDNDNKIFLKLKSIVAEVLNIKEDTVKPDSKFIDDLGAESLDLITLVMELEDEFKHAIPDEDVAGLVTVQDAVNYISNKLDN